MIPGLPDVTVAQLLHRIVAGAVVLGVYGLAAASAAHAVGDEGPKHDGRRSASPIPHLDIFGLLAIVFFRAGWMRPIVFDSKEFARARRGAATVLGIATLSLVVLACLAQVARQLVLRLLEFEVGVTVSSVLAAVSDVALGTALLGLLPLPPLLGSLWWTVVRPGAESLARDQKVVLVGYIVTAAILLSGFLTPAFRWLSTAVARLIAF